MKKIKVLEKEIQKAILDWLGYNKIFHYRNATTGIFMSNGRWKTSQSKGSPDIIAVIKGRYIGIEVKAESKKQSPAQKEFQKNLEKAGGKYILAYSMDEVIHALW